MASEQPDSAIRRDRLPRPPFPNWGWVWIVFAVGLGWNVVTLLRIHGQVTYFAFVKQVRDDNRANVTISGQILDGQLEQASLIRGSTPVESATPGA